MDNIRFIDAQQMTRLYPETFFAPTIQELNALQIGDNVQVCINDTERIWTKITDIEGENITADIDNDPVIIPLKYLDEIKFMKKHIYKIY